MNGGALRLTGVVAVSAGDPPAGSGLPAPELLAPAPGTIVPAEAPAFSWTPVAGASGYRLVAATDPGALPEGPAAGACAACGIDASTALPTHVHEAGLPASTVHWWRVQALPAGEWSASSVFTTSGAVAVQITRPAPGAALDAGSVVVRGVVTPPPGTEVGVAINGVPALRASVDFGARVPLAESVAVIIATARDASGAVVGRHAIPVSVELPEEEPVIGFSVAPGMGTAPHTAHFGFSTRKFVLTLTLDADNDGVPERAGRGAMDADTEPSHTYPDPGLYEPTLTVVTDSDTIDTLPESHTLSEIVRVYSAEELDELFQPKWNAVKDALRAGNVSAALEHVVIRRRSEYADVLDDLAIPLSDIDQELTEIVFDRQLGRSVEYEMHRTENGTTYSYPVVFQLDEDGIWRLEAF